MTRLVLFLLASLSLLTSVILSTGAQAQDSAGARDVAEAYLAAYQTQDFDQMRELYAGDAHFIDPTSFDIPQITAPIDWQGADSIIAGISSWGIQHITYHQDRSYEASNAVIFDGNADVSYATETGARIFNYPIITIITVRDGQVVEHRDYTDYAGAREISAPAPAQ